jgi:thymidylate synthase ThyX
MVSSVLDVERVIDGGPRVTLRRCFADPYDSSIAAARTCYSDRVIRAEEITPGQRQRIGPLTFDGGHHTVFQHATFEFGLEGVSRQLVWSLLHRHPFYNSEQQSQRYVVLHEARAHVPPMLEGELRKRYEAAVLEAWHAYGALAKQIEPVIRRRMASLWKLSTRHSQSFHRSIERDIEKRAIETARYVIPVACHAALVHTVSGIVLHRLRRMVASADVTDEARAVVGQMVALVEQLDPEFFAHVGEPALEPEAMVEASVRGPGAVSARWLEEFDRSLGARRAALVASTPAAAQRVAEAVREVLGLDASELPDRAALSAVLDPSINRHRLETLNVAGHSPLMRALEHAHYVFRKKLSHTADSQDQRHRMVPGSRPLLSRHDTAQPDVIVPELIEACPPARARFDETMQMLWDAKNALVREGVAIELAQYLLPNARAIRFQESGTLLHLIHKWTTRTCLNAQREIYEASMDELEQVRAVHPELVEHVGPPCVVRDGLVRPRCTEGTHFCGVPVWRSFPDVERAL